MCAIELVPCRNI